MIPNESLMYIPNETLLKLFIDLANYATKH